MNVRVLNFLAVLTTGLCCTSAYAGKPPARPADLRNVTGAETSPTAPIGNPPLGMTATQGTSTVGAVNMGTFAMWPGGFVATPIYVVMGPFFPFVIYNNQTVTTSPSDSFVSQR